MGCCSHVTDCSSILAQVQCDTMSTAIRPDLMVRPVAQAQIKGGARDRTVSQGTPLRNRQWRAVSTGQGVRATPSFSSGTYRLC